MNISLNMYEDWLETYNDFEYKKFDMYQTMRDIIFVFFQTRGSFNPEGIWQTTAKIEITDFSNDNVYLKVSDWIVSEQCQMDFNFSVPVEWFFDDEKFRAGFHLRLSEEYSKYSNKLIIKMKQQEAKSHKHRKAQWEELNEEFGK